MNTPDKALEAFHGWYQTVAVRTKVTPRGTIAAALVILESLKNKWDLNLEAHRAQGGSQIKGVGGAALKKILAQFDEHRPFLSEGGRTNRGGPGDIGAMLAALENMGLTKLKPVARIDVLVEFQKYLVDRVRDWHSQKRLTFSFDPSKSAWQIVHEILDEARQVGKDGPVAQYLIGAKLQLRYPDLEVQNFSYSTSDAQQGRSGDFLFGDTAFHVTVSPMTGVYDRCKANLRDGLRVYLIVPDGVLAGTRQNAEAIEAGRIFVDSLEAFVGGNIDEMSHFSKTNVVAQFRRLLEVYNERVNAIEMDKSMMIEIPPALGA